MSLSPSLFSPCLISRKTLLVCKASIVHAVTITLSSQLIMSLVLVVPTIITTATTTLAIVLRDNGGTNPLNLLVLAPDLLSVSLRVRIQPFLAILERILDLLLFVRVHLLAQALVFTRALDRRLHGVHVAIESILCIDTFLHL